MGFHSVAYVEKIADIFQHVITLRMSAYLDKIIIKKYIYKELESQIGFDIYLWNGILHISQPRL